MKFVGEDLTFESTGRKEYCYGTLSPAGPGNVCYGADGGFGNLAPEEIKEMAAFMIACWTQWAQGLDPRPRDGETRVAESKDDTPKPPWFVATKGNAAWAQLEGMHVPTAVREVMEAERQAMFDHAEANKSCVHVYARAPRGAAKRLPTRACIKCGHIKDITPRSHVRR